MLKKFLMIFIPFLSFFSLYTFIVYAEEEIYMDGYLEGYEAAYEDYIYDDFKKSLNEEEQIIYKKGYYAGFIEGGGRTLPETWFYYLFEKNSLYSIIILVFIFFLILLTVNLRNEKTEVSSNVKSNVDTNLEMYPEPSYILHDNEAYDKIIEEKNFNETIYKDLNHKMNTKYDSDKYSENPFMEDGIFYYRDTRTKRAINKGNKGELMVHNELLKIEQIDDYNVLLDLNLIVSNNDYKPTKIDHLVISKYGLFVIETKNYSGIIEGHVFDEYWNVIYKSSVHKLFNPIIQNSTHLYAIKAKLLEVIDESHFINKLPDGNVDFYSGIYSIIVFTGNAKLNIKGQHKDMVLYLPDLLGCVLNQRKEHFTEKQVFTIVNKIIEEDIAVEMVPG